MIKHKFSIVYANKITKFSNERVCATVTIRFPTFTGNLPEEFYHLIFKKTETGTGTDFLVKTETETDKISKPVQLYCFSLNRGVWEPSPRENF